MGYYRIKNVTNELNRRNANYNSVQKIDVNTANGLEVISVLPGADIIVEFKNLPVSAQKLRAIGFINVIDIDKGTYLKSLNAKVASDKQEAAAIAEAKAPVAEVKAVVADQKKKDQKKQPSTL